MTIMRTVVERIHLVSHSDILGNPKGSSDPPLVPACSIAWDEPPDESDEGSLTSCSCEPIDTPTGDQAGEDMKSSLDSSASDPS